MWATTAPPRSPGSSRARADSNRAPRPAHERAALRARHEGDQRVRARGELGHAAAQERDAFPRAGGDEVGEEAAGDAVLDRVPDDREAAERGSAVGGEAPVVAWRVDVAP